MHHALSVSGAASILVSNLPVSSGEVFTISPLAVADRQTLSARRSNIAPRARTSEGGDDALIPCDKARLFADSTIG
jgi:hypothetical protein